MKHLPAIFLSKPLYQSGRPSLERGFTMIELMVTAAILGILASAALFSAPGFVERSRVQAAQSSLTDAINFARSEAVRLRTRVVLRERVPAAACRLGVAANAGGWRCGWIIFADSNANNTLDGAETILRQQETFEQINVEHIAAVLEYVTFLPSAYSQGDPGKFVITPISVGAPSSNTITLCVERFGRIRTLSGNNAAC